MSGWYRNVVSKLGSHLEEQMPRDLVQIVLDYALNLPPEFDHYDPKPGSGRRKYIGRRGDIQRHIGDVLRSWARGENDTPLLGVEKETSGRVLRRVSFIETEIARRYYPGVRPSQVPDIIRFATFGKMESGFKVLAGHFWP